MTTTAQTLTDLMLSVFRVNGRLLEKGDRLVAGLSLTSARWQVLGAIALAERPVPAPQIAEIMGITRQGAQKQLNLLVEEGIVVRAPNPFHERSPLYSLTDAGIRAWREAERLCALWTEDLSPFFSAEEAETALKVLTELHRRLNRPLPTDPVAP
ncbi:MarR family winged helix-turn-helix transcriptional regulator [Magnetospirillum fulvum]|uniref:DNA-binding transcriptional regulator, MarR family n=1 Tax=Magnetospirillum fulvum TaxID=1082 RepID=A0A1H6I182_MAGFU|nr:MarR family winged helix-turn-helix transcriptional regulator [Magnetospirillum fulvum]SEH40272.1 DNA-binding transcriptional regulator, MarR family [Magnetospirillum fulvum]